MTRKGDTWNESRTYLDAWTRRTIRQVTTAGCYNETPTYHTATAWTADGEQFVFRTGRSGQSALMVACARSGDMTQLTDWVDGMALDSSNGVAPTGIGGGICVSPTRRWVTFVLGSSLRAVHLDTLQEHILIEDVGPWAMGSASIDRYEQYVVVAANIIPEPMRTPQTVGGGERFTRGRANYFNEPGGAHLRILRVPLAGGHCEVIYDEPGVRSGHVQYCPADSDLLLIDRDFPPRFWFGSDGKTNRIWTLRISTGELTELPSRSGALFQVHSVWNWEGDRVLYHCPTPQGYVIGVDDRQGRTVWEHQSPAWTHYGHVSAMAGRAAFILDGNLSDDLLLWMDYEAELPRIEVIVRHGTDWNGHEGQYPHPHPQSDPTGRYISFNAAHKGQSNVFVVQV